MKRILLTGGPTNEFVDEVMKITNMSTGGTTVDFAAAALDKGDEVTAVLCNSVLGSARYARLLSEHDASRLKIIAIETTQDMYDALKAEAESGKPYDVVIHAAAVGDYKPQFSFRMEDMAAEITEAIMQQERLNREETEALILKVMTDPRCTVRDDSKISSYEPNLTVKLTLTTKIIANLRTWFPRASIIGFKLLENVPREHLIEVARKLCVKNNVDFIMANDLALIRNGQPVRYMVDKDGYTGITLNAEGCPAMTEYVADRFF